MFRPGDRIKKESQSRLLSSVHV